MVDTVEVGNSTQASSLAVTPNGAYVYVANIASFNVSAIDTVSNTVVATVPVGMTPQGVAIVGIVASTQPTQVSINIKPGSNPNSINTCSGGTTPVAIFGSDTLDVTTIDPGSLMLASATVKTVGKSNRDLCNVEDIGSVDETAFDSLDTFPDGFDDLVCHFITFNLTDLADTSEDATLDGNLADGTAIEGLDSVNIVKDCS